MRSIGAGGITLALGTSTVGARQRAGARPGESIVDIAVSSDDFNVLVAAVVEAGLVDVLSGNRQLTVFAPTDDAFNAIGVDEDNVGNLDPAFLLSVLTYHVTNGRRYAQSIVRSPRVNTLQGSPISVDGTELNDGQANIVATDIEASNGVIHVIDGVLLPP